MIFTTKLRLFQWLFILSLPLFTACTQVYYASHAGHTLGLDEKGDIKISAAILSDPLNSSGPSLQAGYSPKKHIGIQLNYSGLKHDSSEKGYMFNQAVGYYHFINFDKPITEHTKWIQHQGHKAGILFDVYGGFAFGHSFNTYPITFIPAGLSTTGGNVRTKLHQYYLQEGLHIYFLRLLKFTLSHRLSLLNFREVRVIGGIGSQGIDNLKEIKAGNPFIFNELSAKLNFGFPKFNIFSMISVGFSNNNLAYSEGTFQIGIAMDIDDIIKRKGTIIK